MVHQLDQQPTQSQVTDPESIRPVPHALGVEKAALSVIFQEPEKLDECPTLTPDHFFIPAHKIIFDAARTTISENKPLELVSFVERLRGAGVLDRVGGPSAVTDIYTYQPSSESFGHHIDILSEHLARRVAIRKAGDLIDAAYGSDMESVVKASGEAASAVSDVLTDSTTPRPLKAILSDSVAKFEARARGVEDSMGIPSIQLIDDKLRGLHPGRVWIIGAYPGGGKSVMASQILIDAALAGTPGLFLSLEMSERDLMDRMVIQAARIDALAYTEPMVYAANQGLKSLPVGILRAVQSAAQKIRDAPLRLQMPANRRLATVIAAIRKAKREMGIQIAAVDYLQLIRGNSDGTREGEISEISHAIQQEAQSLGISILILSQLNADGETKHGKVIEEDADAVINIIQDRDRNSETFKVHRHVLIAKDRYYGTSGERIPLVLDKSTIRFIYGEDPTKTATKPKWER